MNAMKIFTVAGLVLMLVMAGAVQAKMSEKDALKIGKKSLQQLIDQSYHYRIEYDTVIVLPVHSKTIWKNDFYLLYFLKDNYFQAEMEIDQVTKVPTILAMGQMDQPYYKSPSGIFNYRYFDVDSILYYTSLRRHLQQDSARLVYFGIIPKLGKRGVAWEVFSSEGIVYISPGGPNMTQEQLVRDINTEQEKGGNYTADSIRMIDIMAEIERLNSLPDADKRKLKMYPQTYDSLMTSLENERKQIIMRFPKLGRYFPMTE